MANTLLDFVMSLVRDPDAAARYAADPAQAIADAHLTDVTSADVNNLIPVVSESLSMTAPTGGLDAFGAESAGNVWASGAATAAFDAFGDHVPVDAGPDVVSQVIEQPTETVASGLDALTDSGLVSDPFDEASLQVTEPVIDDAITTDPVIADDWAQPVVDDQHHTDGVGGFDIFD
ncbi:Rv0340 family IniB-related protein [Mycolicibacterium wolinskyi]|uniref:Rv0340 family IniB-related protein n=1 Tax=Mycolicibacterium wolinskyi TaxID=59750 RepID=UPI0039178015